MIFAHSLVIVNDKNCSMEVEQLIHISAFFNLKRFSLDYCHLSLKICTNVCEWINQLYSHSINLRRQFDMVS